MSAPASTVRAPGPVDQPSPAPCADPVRLVALGDSVTVGVGDAGGAGWAVHLAALLGAEPTVLAANGARARDLVGEQLAAACALRPGLAVLMIGGNDVLRGDFDAAEVERCLAQAVSAVLVAGAVALVVVPPPVGPELPAPAAVRRVLTRRMAAVRAGTAEVLSAAARRHPGRVVVVDAAVVRDRGGVAVFHIDRIHPSPLGHRLLAVAAAEQLAALGWRVHGAPSPVPPPPALPARVGWLVVRGVPWLVRRSRDLLPELISTVVREEWRRRRQ